MKEVLIGGTFDILHSGHVGLLKEAKTYGDRLVVMVSSDQRVKHKKGEDRPIFSQEERRLLVESLRMVDIVIIGTGDPEVNPIFDVLREVRPDIYIRTNDVNPENLEYEVNLCNELGIEMITIDRIDGIQYMSSTEIIERIKC